MSNITQYTKDNQIFYQFKSQTFCAYASGASGSSGASGVSGASYSSGASGASGASGYYVDVVRTVTVDRLSIVQLASLIQSGEIEISEVEKWCKSKNVPYEITEKENLNSLSFKYYNKQYTLNSNKKLDTNDSVEDTAPETTNFCRSARFSNFFEEAPTSEVPNISQSAVRKTSDSSIAEGANLDCSLRITKSDLMELSKLDPEEPVDISKYLPMNVMNSVYDIYGECKVVAMCSDGVLALANGLTPNPGNIVIFDNNENAIGGIDVYNIGKYYKDSPDKITWTITRDNQYDYYKRVVKGDDYTEKTFTKYQSLYWDLHEGKIGIEELSKLKLASESSIEALKDLFSELNSKTCSSKESLMNILDKFGYTDLQHVLSEYEEVVPKTLGYILEAALIRTDMLEKQKNICDLDKADGQIYNEKTMQGLTGDCWFLASLMNLSLKEDFQNYLKEITTIDRENKTYSMTLQGKTYTFTFDEIHNAAELSNGDPDVRFQEMVMRQLLAELGVDGNIDGGTFGRFVEKMLGSSASELEFYDTNPRRTISGSVTEKNAALATIDEIAELLSSGNYIVQFSARSAFGMGGSIGYDANDDVIQLPGGHAYDVIEINDKYVTVRNPHSVDGKNECAKIDRAFFEIGENNMILSAYNFNQFLELFKKANADANNNKETDLTQDTNIASNSDTTSKTDSAQNKNTSETFDVPDEDVDQTTDSADMTPDKNTNPFQNPDPWTNHDSPIEQDPETTKGQGEPQDINPTPNSDSVQDTPSTQDTDPAPKSEPIENNSIPQTYHAEDTLTGSVQPVLINTKEGVAITDQDATKDLVQQKIQEETEKIFQKFQNEYGDGYTIDIKTDSIGNKYTIHYEVSKAVEDDKSTNEKSNVTDVASDSSRDTASLEAVGSGSGTSYNSNETDDSWDFSLDDYTNDDGSIDTSSLINDYEEAGFEVDHFTERDDIEDLYSELTNTSDWDDFWSWYDDWSSDSNDWDDDWDYAMNDDWDDWDDFGS